MNDLKKKGLETSKETRIGLNELLPNTHSILDIQTEREKKLVCSNPLRIKLLPNQTKTK